MKTNLAKGLMVGLMLLAMGAEAADVQRGEQLASTWCQTCHLTAPDQLGSLDAAPPFTEITRTVTKREGDLRAWLADPHPPMPDFDLTFREINDLLSYIKSLAAR